MRLTSFVYAGKIIQSGKLEYDSTELLRFLARDFVHMNSMCDRGGMREPDIEARTRSLFEYFNLPYQAG